MDAGTGGEEGIPRGQREPGRVLALEASAAFWVVEKEARGEARAQHPARGGMREAGCSLGLITVPLGPDQTSMAFSKTTRLYLTATLISSLMWGD